MTEPVSPRAQRELAVTEAADRVVPLAEAEPTYFNCAIVEDPSALVIAFCELPSAELRQMLTDAAGSVPLRIRIVRHSFSALRTVMDRITDETEMWKQQGIQLSQWGPSWATNRVEVHLVQYSPEAAAQILNRYGADLVEVVPHDTPLAIRG